MSGIERTARRLHNEAMREAGAALAVMALLLAVAIALLALEAYWLGGATLFVAAWCAAIAGSKVAEAHGLARYFEDE